MSARNAGYSLLSSSQNAEEGRTMRYDAVGDTSASLKTLQLQGGSLSLHDDGINYSYAYGPLGLAGLRNNRYAFWCAFFASLGGLEFGYDQGVIANVLVMRDFTRRWPLSPLQVGTMTALLELGALLGALIAGIHADRHSRRYSIVVACIVFCVGSVFQCLATNLAHLFIGRGIGGIGVGALSMLAPLYMAEISPPEVRGSLMALEQFSIVLGVVFGFWMGFLTRHLQGSLAWRIPLGIQIVPAIILAVGCYYLPPSPRLLVLQGKHTEAKESLAKLRSRTPEESQGDVLLQIEFLEMRVETLLVARRIQTETVGQDTEDLGWSRELRAWTRLFTKNWRNRTWVGIMIMVFQQWSGINALLYYGPTLVKSIGLQADTVILVVSGGIGIVQFLAVLPAIAFVDSVGRKPLLRGGSIAMTLSHLGIAVLIMIFSSSWATHPAAAWAAVGLIYTFTFAYGTSFGPIGWILPSEVFPLSMRTKGVAISTASNWTNNFFVGLLTPILVDFSAPLTFFIFASACAAAYLWATFVVPETANVSLEEVDALFNSSAGQEDARIKDEIEQELGLRDLIATVVGEPDDP